jgi:hypothetical protein
VRRLVAWLLGGIAVFGFLKRRKTAKAEAPDAPDPRADTLRQKLAEARTIADERDEFEAAETPVDAVEPMPESPERRRQDVHEAGREITGRMREQR